MVEVPKPDLAARADFARVLQERYPEVRFDLSPERLAAETGGLSLAQMEDILQRTHGARAPLGPEQVVGRKIDLLKQEYGDVLEILSPRYDLSAVGGLDHAVRELREVAEMMKKGQTSAAPMGIVLMGPPGTGKSYLAECFAKECGILCVRFGPCVRCTWASRSAIRRKPSPRYGRSRPSWSSWTNRTRRKAAAAIRARPIPG